MKRVVMSLMMALGLSACGVAGEPVKPDVGMSTTVGVNSKGGGFTDTSINIHFPAN
ncbi:MULTISPECIES: argininosuccinate lyase [Celeribacter]|uniref:argininosuccinate lyase n=1 Tax=Celeribacter TaxID=875170 RepID=UPI001CFB7F74|nr:argininosuccinate lyase [Celeribacter naphthalenivorans]